MNYFARPEISNSDLEAVKKHFYGTGFTFESEDAFKFGTLFDAIVTEQSAIDFLHLSIGEYKYSREEFTHASRMKQSLLKDLVASSFLKVSQFQFIKTSKFDIDTTQLPVRCKYDGWISSAGFGWDLKSTSARTQREFEKHIQTFSYYRQRAFYMDISGAQKDMLIGVSKHMVMGKYPVFKVCIDRNSDIYKEGKAEYLDLCQKLIELSK